MKKMNLFSGKVISSNTGMFTRFLSLTLVLGLVFFASCNMESSSGTEDYGTTEVLDDYVTQDSESQAAMSPAEAVQILKEGNARFVNKEMINRDYISQVQKTSTGQYPFAAVVSCIDSRIPTEIVFDQGVGDIFNARIAGNFVNTDILGSLEFAAAAAGAKTIVVMGHTACGAVKGAVDDVQLGNLTSMLDNIEPAINAISGKGERSSSNNEFVQAVADKNVELTIEKIKSDSEVLAGMIEKGEISVVGAMYDVATGKVTFF